MHKGAEFSRLQRVLNFFLKRATEMKISSYRNCMAKWTVAVNCTDFGHTIKVLS